MAYGLMHGRQNQVNLIETGVEPGEINALQLGIHNGNTLLNIALQPAFRLFVESSRCLTWVS